MTYFESDNGNRVEISDDFSMYKSSVNLFDFTLKGNYSVTFQVPNNSYFKTSLGYFSPLQNPSVGFSSQNYNLVKNGTVIDRGKLILEREDKDFLYLFFASGNANWLVNIPDISVKDIDYDDFAISYDTTVDSYSAATSGFCFPLIDVGYNGVKNTGKFSTLLYDNTADYINGTLTDFPPCFFIKSAMQSIFKYCQLKIGGDLLNDPIYQQMVITPESGQIKRANKFFTDRKVSLSPSANSPFGKINLDVVNGNGPLLCWDASLQRYNVKKACTLTVFFNINMNISCYSKIDVHKNGSSFATQLSAFTGGCGFLPNGNSTNFNNNDAPKYVTTDCYLGGKVSRYFTQFEVTVSDGDYLEFYANFGGTSKGTVSAAGGSFPGGGSALAGDWYTVSGSGPIGSVGPCILGVSNGDVIQAKVNNAGNCASDWLYFPVGAGFNVLPQTTISIQPKEVLQVFSSGGIYDILRASDILPDIKMIELIKFVSQYFCAPPMFDISTQTVTFNKLDNFDYTKALDWSGYIQKLENNFQIQTARYNFIRFKQQEDGDVNALTSNNTLRYGDVMIQGQSSTKITNDIYQFPFGATLDKMTKGINRMLIPSIPYVDIELDGSPAYISSVSNNAGLADFTVATAMTDSTPGLTDKVYFVYGALTEYNGYISISGMSGTTVHTQLTYTNTCNGYIQAVKFSFRDNQSRILFFAGSKNVSSFSDYSGITVPSGNVNHLGYAYFSKPTTSYTVSSAKQGLNLDYYIAGYADVPRRLDNYKNLSRILNAPYIKAWFLLPEVVYAAFNMDKFIYLRHRDQQKYYYVDSIENYKDSKTLVQVNMLLLI